MWNERSLKHEKYFKISTSHWRHTWASWICLSLIRLSDLSSILMRHRRCEHLTRMSFGLLFLISTSKVLQSPCNSILFPRVIVWVHSSIFITFDFSTAEMQWYKYHAVPSLTVQFFTAGVWEKSLHLDPYCTYPIHCASGKSWASEMRAAFMSRWNGQW